MKLMQPNVTAAPATQASIRSDTLGILGALVFGLFIVFTVGFAGSSVLHAAAHDTRHSVAFPCH